MIRWTKIILENRLAAVLVGLYLVTLVWWVSIAVRGMEDTTEAYWYCIFFTLIPFIGGAVSLVAIRHSREQLLLNKAEWFLSLGLVLWAVGSFIFGYYNIVLNVAVPFPSLADVGFVPALICWVVGLLYLAKSCSIGTRLTQLYKRGAILFMPLCSVVIIYYLLLVIIEDGTTQIINLELKNLLDFTYTILDVIILITLAILIYSLIFKLVDHKYSVAIILLIIGFGINYFSDLYFGFTTSAGIYKVGNWVDLLFPIGLFFIALGVVLLSNQYQPLNQVTASNEKV